MSTAEERIAAYRAKQPVDHFRGEALFAIDKLSMSPKERAEVTARLARLNFRPDDPNAYDFLMRSVLWGAVAQLVRMGDEKWVTENVKVP
jgi:hypothetical protein